jgi:hypothetical protein
LPRRNLLFETAIFPSVPTVRRSPTERQPKWSRYVVRNFQRR